MSTPRPLSALLLLLRFHAGRALSPPPPPSRGLALDLLNNIKWGPRAISSSGPRTFAICKRFGLDPAVVRSCHANQQELLQHSSVQIPASRPASRNPNQMTSSLDVSPSGSANERIVIKMECG
ncbi:hypothetical protein GWI33_018692 [Rhynchophorus ferrugineus]|uniref:Secreted protein n=1 Tax=Rhynchophorus ferrugineus TaxID=354439 RepID=A0A834HZQ8_RHYFE|nr:hypothetical protein GWI33_018692 [Rhynchophorus ferrugineus]